MIKAALLRQREIALFLLCCGIHFALHWSRLDAKFFHDEGFAYIKALFDLADNGWDYILGNPRAFYNHPPLMYFFFYPVVKIFGYDPVPIRTLILLWVSVGYYFTFKTAQIIFNNALKAWAVVLAVAFAPYWWQESFAYFGDTFLLPFFSIYSYMALTERRKGVFWGGVLAGFARESAIALGPAFAAWDIWKSRGLKKSHICHLGTFVGYGAFLIFEKIKDGRFIDHNAVVLGDISFTPSFFLKNFSHAYEVLFIFHGRWFLVNVALAGWVGWVIWAFYRRFRQGERPLAKVVPLLPLFLTCLIFSVFFFFDKGVINRYLNPVHPFLIIIGFYPILETFSSKWGFLTVLTLVLSWNSKMVGDGMIVNYMSGKSKLGSTRIAEEAVKALRFYENSLEGKPILNNLWPFYIFQQDPRMGYVSKRPHMFQSAHELRDTDSFYYLWSTVYNENRGDREEVKTKANLEKRYDFSTEYEACDYYSCFYIYKLMRKSTSVKRELSVQ